MNIGERGKSVIAVLYKYLSKYSSNYLTYSQWEEENTRRETNQNNMLIYSYGAGIKYFPVVFLFSILFTVLRMNTICSKKCMFHAIK